MPTERMSQGVSPAITLPVHDGAGLRRCWFCELPIPNHEKSIEAKTKNAWAHFECWYDGTPFNRHHWTGEQL